MKTEISRNSRQAKKHYSGVYQQQGRMFTDSDVNEQVDISKQRLNSALADAIVSGMPREGGLSIVLDTTVPDIKIRSGRIYIDGLPAEVTGDGALVALNAQTDFPSFPAIDANEYLLYADVWERTVTALEDGRLLDDGLHGADTCTRSQTMCQIKWCKPTLDPESPTQNPTIGSAELTLTMRAASTAKDQCDPCADIVNLATRSGNYLFRVEVHDVQYVNNLPASGIAAFTLKWSAENGAEHYRIDEAPDNFKLARVYEFFNASSEKHLGVHLATAADFPLRGDLQAGYPISPPATFDAVRRWDGYCTVDLLSNTLIDGIEHGAALSSTNAANSIAHIELGTTLTINLSAMKLQLHLDGKQLVAGDYWLGEVREDAVDTNALLPKRALPEGIRHHYLSLAEIDAGKITLISNADCKRHGFPPLNDIHASDVCVDPLCEELYGDAETVQGALEQLCRQKGLKYHNKHLHGWGIVCGLQLECAPAGAPDERQHIIIQHGSAIDCDGTDLEAKHAKRFPILEALQALEKSAHQPLLNSKGNGDFCISLEGVDQQGKPLCDIKPYQPGEKSWQDNLSNTLLMDFYNDCIKKPFDMIRKLLMPHPDAKDLVQVSDERLITILNLLIQLNDPSHGQYVYLSPKEDKILRELYALLKQLLSSEAYCAMFDGLPEFPDYPFPNSPFSTVFGPISKARWHNRLRVHPDGIRAYTLGGKDNYIHVFDLENEQMQAEIPHPGGENCVVQDVAFAPDGEIIYASALLDGKTVLAVGQIDDFQIKWHDSKILCNHQFVTLATSLAKPFSVYAIAKGQGLFEIDPTAALVKPKQILACNAIGHLIISKQEPAGIEVAYITVGTASQTDRYNEVRAVSLKPDTQQRFISFTWKGLDVEGEDDIAIAFDIKNKTSYLYVVVGLSSQAVDKKLLKFGALNPELLNHPIALENTDIQLAYLQNMAQLLITFSDSYRMTRLDVSDDSVVLLHHPLQIAPSSIVATDQKAFVLNSISDTISLIPAKAESIDLQQLAAYRKEVLTAFSALTTGIIQYLKDCFCHHLLVKCPECNEDDTIYLGTVSIRNHQVSKVCNFSKRKYVKSFPTIAYWMSILPFGNWINAAMEKLCCSVIPNLFDQFGQDKASPIRPQTNAQRPGLSMRNYAYMIQNADVSRAMTRKGENISLMSQLAKQALATGFQDSLIQPEKGLRKTALVDQPVEAVRQSLGQRGVNVNAVQDYSAQSGLKRVIDFANTPEYLKTGDNVTLYQQDGVVKYYAIDPSPTAKTVSTATLVDSDAIITQLAELAELAELNASKENLSQEVSDLQSKSQQVSELLKQQAEMAAEIEASLAVQKKTYRELKIEIIKDRPVREINGIGSVNDAKLREIGIRTTNELANSSDSNISKSLGISKAQAGKLIESAQLRIKQA